MMATDNSQSLSGPVRDLLGAFERLTEDDQRDFFSEIMRRTKDLEWPPLDEETINRIADESFLEYDNREAADAQGRSG
jgi:hypothetical protein